MKPYLIIAYLIVCVVLGALVDTLFNDGAKLFSHLFGAVEIFLVASGAFIFNLKRRHWLWYMAAFAAWHIVGFDYMYNLFAGLPWDYHGTTSWWDLFLSKYPEHGIIFTRVIFLLAGVFIPIRELNNE